MIPHSLFIKNFLSYGSAGEQISFDPYHLICLSGKNGHGKSALLDALTWAIWGQARKTLQSVKPDQGLLRLGQSQMIVIAEFSCNGQRYRIRREYMNHHNKPYAQLEFGLLEGEKLIPLTDKTIKATQEAIINTIKLDYEAFCNTVFLRQGASNEFSKKSAKERKELLAAILGLNTYEQVRKLALHKIKTAHIEHTHTNNSMQRLSKQIIDHETIAMQYQQEQEALVLAQKKISSHVLLSKKIDQEKNLLYEAEQQLQQLSNHYNELEKNKTNIFNELSKLYVTLRTNKKQRTNLPTVPVLLKKQTELLNIVDAQQTLHAQHLATKELLIATKQKKQEHEQKKREEFLSIEQEYAQSMQHIEQELQQCIFHHRSLESTLTERQKELAHIDGILNAEQQNDAYYKELQNMIHTMEKEVDKKKTGYQKIVAHGNMLATKHKELSSKIESTHDIYNPSCPLCEQNLSLARKKFLRTKFEKALIIVSHQLKRITRMLPLFKNRIISHHETVQSLKKEELTYAAKQGNKEELMRKKLLLEIQNGDALDSLKKYMQQAENLTQTITQKKEMHLQLMPSIDNDPEYKELVIHIAHLTQKATEHPYNKQTHTQAIIDLEDVHKALALCDTSHNMVDLQKEMQRSIRRYIHEIRSIQCEQKKQLVKIAEQKQVVYTFSTVHQKIKLWQKEQEHLLLEKEELIKRTTSLQHQVEQNAKTVSEIKDLEKIIISCESTIEDYSAIATATGKDGIQALLIEEAIPSIENEANKLLARLTQNNARIFIDSLKDLKNGGTKETLDIKIADNAGIRPYELFSGGEAFRIDFALRIAVSTLLAQRAGTSLQTLIIDEGFGSQDEEGLSHITNMLYKIQDSFAKIIIVSHLPSMKDQFPVHFVIDKTTQGSTVKIMELG